MRVGFIGLGRMGGPMSGNVFGVAAGVDLGALRASLLASPAASHFVEADVLSVLRDGDYDEGLALALACKDLGLAVDPARATGVPAAAGAADGEEPGLTRAAAQG